MDALGRGTGGGGWETPGEGREGKGRGGKGKNSLGNRDIKMQCNLSRNSGWPCIE